MAKDPAFLFYPGDWNLGTMHLTLLEKGCYIELLVLQFAKGKFTVAQAKHMLNGSFDVVWANLAEKFATDGTYYWNKRLKIEQEKRQKFTESRRSNALVSKKGSKQTEAYGEHMHKHMEDENENNKVKYWFLQYYHSNYDFYKSKFNGQSTTEDKFNEWKRFVDFIYHNQFEEVFECKFISPHDFAKLKDFPEGKWEAPIRMLLSTGIKPEHNLFFRIPEFIKHSKKSNGNPNTTTSGNIGKTIEFDSP